MKDLPFKYALQGRKLKELREQQGFNQISLAAKSELDQRTLSALERGRVMPSAESRTKLSAILGAKIDEIDWPPPEQILVSENRNKRQPQRSPPGSLGSQLRALRLALYLSQNQVARHLNVPDQTYSRIESGYIRRADLKEKLAELLGAEVLALYDTVAPKESD